MGLICVEAPPLIMMGSLELKSTINVVTKAQLASIEVQGGCSCPAEKVDSDAEEADEAPTSPSLSSASSTSSISDECVDIVKDIEADLAYLVDRSDSITRGMTSY